MRGKAARAKSKRKGSAVLPRPHDPRPHLAETAPSAYCDSSPTEMQKNNTAFSVVALVMAAAGGEFSPSDPYSRACDALPCTASNMLTAVRMPFGGQGSPAGGIRTVMRLPPASSPR